MMFFLDIIKKIYFALTIITILVPIQAPLTERLPGLVLMWISYCVFTNGFKKIKIKKSNAKINSNLIANNKTIFILSIVF